MSAAITAAAFAGGGGTNLSSNTVLQVALLVLAAAVLVWGLLCGSRGQRWGATSIGLFVALSALTYLSLAWSVQPGASWLEANRTLSYLAAFGAAFGVARLAPEHWRGLVVAIAVSATAIAGYALLAKIFPGSLDPGDPLGRLSAPLGYWNAVGGVAAMGVPAALWVGSSPGSPRALRILAPGALALLIAALLMSFSRGSLAIAVIGLALWFWLVPLRLRGAAVLGLGAAAGAAISGWALPSHALSDDNVALHVRTSSGHTFGFVVLLAVLLTCAGALALTRAMDRVKLSHHTRRRVGTVLVGLAALLPLGGVAALAASSRGLTGEVSHIWSTLTSSNSAVGGGPSRLLSLSNTRTRYWSEGLTVGEHHLLAGTGALGFAVAHQRYSTSASPISHAHNFLIENFADFGLIGVLLSLALLVAWGAAAGRTVGLEPSRDSRWRMRAPPAEERTAEWGALVTMLVVVVAFGLHNLIDWTWFIPGAAMPALACAGWLAGRGPLSAPVGRASGCRRLLASPALGMGIVAIVAVVVALGWVIVSPLRANDLDSSAETALLNGDSAGAVTDAREAVAANPLALEPLYVLSAVYTADGQNGAARHELVDGVNLQPANPSPWQELAAFDIASGRTAQALAEVRRARTLDPLSPLTAKLLAQAQTGR